MIVRSSRVTRYSLEVRRNSKSRSTVNRRQCGQNGTNSLCELGCGKFFEGDANQMHSALNKTLGSLPDDTKVYVRSKGKQMLISWR
jgi:hypothetical protein